GLSDGAAAAAGLCSDRRERCRWFRVRRRGRRGRRLRGHRRGAAGGAEDLMPDEPQVTEQESGDEVAALQAERDELFDRLQRLAAEFDNFRKRNAREAAATIERANELLVKELLPVLDDLGRALEAAEETEGAKLEEGVRPVHRSLADPL